MEPLDRPLDPGCALFLDRDGVVNDEIVGSYVTHWEEFQFSTGALPALEDLARIFPTIVVVTNQRGVGRGIMSFDSLQDINHRTLEAVRAAGGRIDRIYACTAVADTDHNRKPNIGMGLQAKQDFPQIHFGRSVMVGNSLSDMEFGKRLGMHTVFLTTKSGPYSLPHDLIDEQFPSLAEWTASLMQARTEPA